MFKLMGLFLYNLWLILILPVFVPLFVLNNLLKKRPLNLLLLSHAGQDQRKSRYLWILAASAGEVLLAKRIIEKINPDQPWLVITTTHSGYQMARQVMPESVSTAYFPTDFGFIIRKIVKLFPPALFLIVETEFWPNLIAYLSREKVETVLLNGRVNKRTWDRYQPIKFVLKDLLQRVSLYCVQTQTDRDALIKLGAPAERFRVFGNIKFDLIPNEYPNTTSLATQIGLTAGKKLVVAGSTHAGEEELILAVFERLLPLYPELILVIAPRHLERVAEVERLIWSRNLQYRLWSEATKGANATKIILLDTFGELACFYSLAYFAMVGGSFVNIGGHNILEPAALGAPVLFGKYMQNFSEAKELLVKNGVGFLINNFAELAEKCEWLLNNETEQKTLSQKAKTVINENRGALGRSVDLIRSLGF